MGLTMLREQASGLNRDQRNAFVAAWLGWAMDAFDYFLLVFVISDVAEDVRHDQDASRGRHDADARRAAGRRGDLRLRGRQEGPAAGAARLRALLLDRRVRSPRSARR